jgi:hypothetical protein
MNAETTRETSANDALPDGGLKLRLEPCESWGKYVLEIWNGERWEALHTDYLGVVEAIKQKIEAASHDTAELTRLRAERDKATETLSAYYPRKDGKPPLSVLANWAGNELERLRPENERLNRALLTARTQLRRLLSVLRGAK